MNTRNPFELLLDLESRTLKGSAGLPVLDLVAEEWVGIGFRVGTSKLIAAMSDVKEILDVPAFTPVPGVKSWIVGVANVRGSLLPILDMKTYLLGEDTPQRDKSRMIVIDYKGFNTGLIVDEVYGMRHFRKADATEDIPDMHEGLLQYVEKVFLQDKEHWPVFDFKEMTLDERFAHASL